MKTIIKNHNYKGTNFHEVMVYSPIAYNTGHQKVYARNYQVRFGMLDKWIEQNPNKKIIKVFDHIYKG